MSVPLPLVNLWNMRSMLFYFAVMNVKTKFKGTVLGLTWAAIEPLLIFIILYTVFSSIQVTDRPNFGIYLLTGIIFFHIFSRGSVSGISSIRNYRGWILSINIRKEFFPVLSVTTTVITTAIEIGVFFALMPFLQFTPGLSILLFPITVVLLLLLVLGSSYLLSIVNMYIRDVQLFWGILLQALFFMTPIFWYLQDINNPILLIIHKINPLGQLIEIAHSLVVYDKIPPLIDWMYPVVFTISLVFVGYAVFQKYEKKIVEVI